MDARDNRRRLSDGEVERLLAEARPEPARLPEATARALFARALEASGAADSGRSRRSFAAPRWALAAAACAFAFVAARVAWTPDTPAPSVVVERPAEMAVAPARAPKVVAAAPAPPVRVSSPATASRRPAQRIARAVRHRAVTLPEPSPSGAAGTRVEPAPVSTTGADESLASLLIVTADNSPADVTAVEAPPDTEGFARVAAYDETGDGAPVVRECVVTRDSRGELNAEFVAASPVDSEQGPYLKVEPAESPAP